MRAGSTDEVMPQHDGVLVFLSYRHDDAPAAAGALFQALQKRLGHGRVFQDVGSIELGEAYGLTIRAAIRQSAVVVVLIGPRWDPRRLAKERDWVRQEILLAVETGTLVVPVRVDGADLPDEDDLPEELRFLPGLQGYEWRTGVPVDDLVDRLTRPLARVLESAPAESGYRHVEPRAPAPNGDVPAPSVARTPEPRREQHAVPIGVPRFVRRRRLVAALTAVALVGAASLVMRAVAGPAPGGTPCGTLGQTTGPGFHLWKSAGGECLGWTVTQDYGFDGSPATSGLVSGIIARNTTVADQQKYVRVAVMMPMTGDGAMLTSGIENALRGASVAQARAADPDQDRFLGGHELGVQIVLANMGRDATHWQDLDSDRSLIDDLKALAADPDHPLVAVTGLGSSLDTAEQAAGQLSEAGIPAIGAALTASELTGQPPALASSTLLQIAPSTDQLVAAVHGWVARRWPDGTKPVGWLVQGGNDPYTRSVAAAFRREFDDRFELSTRHTQFTGTLDAGAAAPNLLSGSAREIRCSNADIVFYAGRLRDLASFVDALTKVQGCPSEHPVTVAVATIGSDALATGAQGAGMRAAHVSLVEATVTDARGWLNGRDAPPGFQPFHDYYRGMGLPDDELADGYAIVHHDAVITAVYAARRLVETGTTSQSPPITAANLGIALVDISRAQPVPAASGALFFGDIANTRGRPHNKPIPLTTWPDGLADSSVPPLFFTP